MQRAFLGRIRVVIDRSLFSALNATFLNPSLRETRRTSKTATNKTSIAFIYSDLQNLNLLNYFFVWTFNLEHRRFALRWKQLCKPTQDV
jgi:hypothetical protein